MGEQVGISMHVECARDWLYRFWDRVFSRTPVSGPSDWNPWFWRWRWLIRRNAIAPEVALAIKEKFSCDRVRGSANVRIDQDGSVNITNSALELVCSNSIIPDDSFVGDPGGYLLFVFAPSPPIRQSGK